MRVWLLTGGFFLAHGGLSAANAGVSGRVTVSSCDAPGEGTRIGRGWHCSGRFDADDGSIHIANVNIEPGLSERPTEPVPVRVEDANSTTAHQADFAAWVPLVASVAFAAIGVGSVWAAVTGRTRVRLPSTPRPSAPPRPRDPDDGPVVSERSLARYARGRRKHQR
jgi:hypothetical protein